MSAAFGGVKPRETGPYPTRNRNDHRNRLLRAMVLDRVAVLLGGDGAPEPDAAKVVYRDFARGERNPGEFAMQAEGRERPMPHLQWGGAEVTYFLAGSKPGDTVLDPFGGSGTTAAVAVGHGRRAIHIDLNPAYIALARERIGPMLCRDAA